VVAERDAEHPEARRRDRAERHVVARDLDGPFRRQRRLAAVGEGASVRGDDALLAADEGEDDRCCEEEPDPTGGDEPEHRLIVRPSSRDRDVGDTSDPRPIA